MSVQTIEDLKSLLGDLASLLTFEDEGNVITAHIRQYLSSQTFSRLAQAIQQLGGTYISEQDKWRFTIPKATVQAPKLPDLTQVPAGTLLKAPLSTIKTGKFYVRRYEDPDEMSRLRESIRRNRDVTYPLACYPLDSSRLELLGGHRRLQACREAGLLTVSVRVFHPKTEREKWELALQDEMHEPWSPMAKARAYQRMREEGISVEDVTLIAGEPYRTVKDYIALNELPEKVQQLTDNGKLGISFALSLLKLKDKPEECVNLAQKAAENSWTRQKLEDEISKILASSAEKGDSQGLPVITGKSFFPEKEPFPRGTRSPTIKPEIEKETQTVPFPTAISKAQPQPAQAVKPEEPAKRYRDAAWDLALRHYPISMVDLVWEKVAAEGLRIPFLKALLNVVWERIVQLDLTQEVLEEARRQLEKRGE